VNIKVVQSGSNREFIILKRNVILIDPDFNNLQKYINILSFLKKNNINVPQIKKIYNNFIILQNLGSKSLLNIHLKLRENRKNLNKIKFKYELT
jgi:aminoglycoside/choline kinase family phosphotransferase